MDFLIFQMNYDLRAAKLPNFHENNRLSNNINPSDPRPRKFVLTFDYSTLPPSVAIKGLSGPESDKVYASYPNSTLIPVEVRYQDARHAKIEDPYFVPMGILKTTIPAETLMDLVEERERGDIMSTFPRKLVSR